MKHSYTRRNAVALAVGTILVALSVPAAHAGPGDGPGSDMPVPKPPKLVASENPVVFGPFDDTRYIDVTAKAYPVTVRVIWKEDGVWHGPGAIMVAGTPTEVLAEITYGKTYTARLETIPEDGMPKEVGPWLTITTVRPEIATTADPQPPEIKINPTLTPRRPVPPAPGDQGAADETPGIDTNPRAVESPGRTTIH